MQISPEVQKQVLEGLSTVATKLGQTGQYAFGLAERQVVIDGVEWGLGFVGCAGVLWFLKSKWVWIKDVDVEALYVVYFIGVILLGVIGFLSLVNSVDFIANPQYWAIARIIDLVKNK